MNIDELNKWAAEACGVELASNQLSLLYLPKDTPRRAEIWTLEDPRCMQVFRERFKITTRVSSSNWMCSFDISERYGINVKYAHGDTVQAAELACAYAIMEASE